MPHELMTHIWIYIGHTMKVGAVVFYIAWLGGHTVIVRLTNQYILLETD